ncbi:MAG: FimV/HubP family polar landmark protein [Sulfuricaulis sp.]|uniref:FimV/HubP family polar landmark protein n=1 Tax=Sulfuricaulis sp. TaxID=2003553 RepID=UPI003C5C0CC6
MALAWRWMIVGMMALFPITSHALALGKLTVLSALNEPLNAEIEFTSATEKELKGLNASLGSRADFDAAGVDRLPLLSQIKFMVVKRADGRYFLELRTDQQLDEPFLHFLLQIEWAGGRLVREYTALIDPPYKISGKAAPVEAPTISAPEPVVPELAMQPPEPPVPAADVPPPEAPIAAEVPKEEMPVMAKPEEPKIPEEVKAEQMPPQEEVAKEAPPAGAAPEEQKLGPPEVAQGAAPQEPAAPTVEPLEAAPKAEAETAPEAQPPTAPETKPAPAAVWAAMPEYSVKKGDTLWRVAENVRGDKTDASIEQVMLAIYRTNKNAFFGNNVNNLKAGKILKVPESEEMKAVTAPEARREFRAQYDAWQEYKLKLASASGAIKVTETPEAAAPMAVEKPAEKPVMPEPAKKAEVKTTTPAPTVADKGKQDELLKIVRSTLQQEKSTPDKKVSEKESAKETAAREQQALADRAATLEESLESKRLENKDLTDKVGLVRSQLKKESRLIELENQSLAQQQKQAAAQKAPEVKPTEPEVKPAEKPVEMPAAAKPEEKIKAEALPPVAKPAPAAPKKRVPAVPAPKVEKDFMATVMEAVQSDLLVPAVIGIVVLLSGGIALVYLRRRQRSIAEFEESILSADAISTEQPAITGNVPGQTVAATTGGDTSFLSDFSQGGMGNIHTDEVDPVAEAEVYLAYGRDETAEEILKEAMVKNPDRQELKLKLLEIYHQRNDVAAFETLAEELYAGLGGRGGKIWEKVEEMGRKLNPENPMFRGGAPAKTSATAALAAAPAGKTSMPSAGMGAGIPHDMEPSSSTPKTEPAGDFDFDMPSSDAKAGAETSLESLDLGTAADNAIDFGIGGKDEAAAGFDIGAPGAAAPASNEIKWEPGATPAAAPDVVLDATPPAGEGQDSAQWDETATKLDLAKAYIDMGDAEGARSILQEVITEGSEAQKKQAQELSAQIA